MSKRREVSSIVAVTPDGRLCARHFRGSVSSPTVILALRPFRGSVSRPTVILALRPFRGSVSSPTVILALRHFRPKVGAPLLVIWDRPTAHRARRTAAFLAAHPQDFAVAYLPAHAPELNPEEPRNACGKRAMANALPSCVADPHRLVRRGFRRLQHRPELIVGCFRNAGLRVTRLR